MFKKALLVVPVTVCAALAATVLPAQAASGSVAAIGGGGTTAYYDKGDYIAVHDSLKDTHGVVGWIEVQQANGSYKAFPHAYNGGGIGSTVIGTQDVLREASRVKVVACLQDTRSGHPYNCGFRYLSGS